MIRFTLPRMVNKKAGTKKDPSAEKIIENGLSCNLKDNIGLFKKLFKNDDTFIVREIENRSNPEISCCIMFIDGMIDVNIINENIIKPINMYANEIKEDFLTILSGQVIQANSINTSEDMDKLLTAVLYGDTLLFAQGYKSALIINTKGWKTRNIGEPELEKVFIGPREGFTESLLQNLSMIRRRVLTNDLKFTFRTFGVRTKTKVCICYIEGIAHESILKELMQRLDSIDLDGILASEYVREFITDAPLSIFNTVYRTERPDTVVGKILEGRIAIIVDGTPVALTVPCMFIENIQSNEDYYLHFQASSFNRILRLIALFVCTSLPGLYIGLVTFHQELIPTPLLMSIAAARQNVPFPTIIELLILTIIFDIIREAGTRTPSIIGQAFSIVGALVLGQAAVEARLVSAPIVIIVAFTGISSLMLPKMINTIIVARFSLLIVSSLMGIFGFIFLFTVIMVHAFSLRSFGVPYMSHIATFDKEDIKDTIVRLPWYYMNFRPRIVSKDAKRKTKKDSRA